jgi:hypothetical protein
VNAVMATQTPTESQQEPTAADRIKQLRDLFADAPEMAKKALENALPALMSDASEALASRAESAGRIGIRQGTVSELTVIAPFAPGGATRLNTIVQ